MRDKPLVSVIVPVYNSELWLENSVSSILNQSYENLEVLLIDDGSTDRSAALCDEFCCLDQRVRVYHKGNGGQATARNLALRKAKGDYIGFVDSDDWIDSNMYSTLVEYAMHTKADIVVCGRNNVTPGGERIQSLFSCDETRVWDTHEALKRFFLYDDIDGSSCDKLFSRKVLESLEYPVGLICEDLPFIYRAIQRAEKIVHVGKPLYNYVQRIGSTSHSSFSKKTEGLAVYPKEIRDEVCAKKRDLRCEADYYYFYNLYTYYTTFYLSKNSDISLIKLGCRDLCRMLCNKYLPKRKRLMMVLFQFKILGKLWAIR